MCRGSIFFALVVIASLACTKTVKLQPADYEEHGSGLLYRIHMNAGCVYLVRSFTANDSTIVVKSLRYPDKDKRDEKQCAPLRSTPFELKRDDIASIEKVEPGIGVPVVVIGVTALVFVVGAIAVSAGGGY
jgi:hypothetical protein